MVDADERGSPVLGDEIARVVASPAGREAFRVPRRNFFLGREVKHGGWASDRPIRLFRSSLRYNASRVHEHVDVEGEIGELSESLVHSTYVSLDDYFEKLDRYSRWWAEDRYERGKRAGALSVAAALSGKAGNGPIVAVVSGGNIDLDKFFDLISSVSAS